MNAIVKAIQKVMQWITKALTKIFGRVIGGALAGLINSVINILTFPVHVAYYSLQGDWKGLFKYMAQTALQIAMIAIQFIPGVGQALGALFQFLGSFFQFMGSLLVGLGTFLGKALGFIPFFGPALGGIVKGALHFAGGFLEGFGGALIEQGRGMIQKSKENFLKLKDQGFTFIKDSLAKGFQNIVNPLNPVTYYQNLSRSVTQSLNELGLKGSLERLLDWSTTQFMVNLAQNEIDKALEKTKMDSFWQSVLSTVSRAGIQGMGDAFMDGILPPQQALAEATQTRAPPTGLSGIMERIKNTLSSIPGLATDALKDTAGFIKSLFIRESSSSLSPALQDELLNYTGELGFDSEGNPLFYKPLGLPASIEYRPSQTGENIRFDLDGGELQFFKRDPSTRFIGSGERVGNLETKPSFIQSLRNVADQGDLFIDASSNAAIDFFGPVGLSPTSTQIFLGREYAKGLIDTLRFGDQFSAIQSDFLSAQASFQKGDYLDAAKSFGSAGLKVGTELSRFATIAPLVGGALRGIGSLKAANSVSRGVTFFDKEIADAVRTSGRLGRAGREVFYSPAEDISGLTSRSQIVRATGNADRVTQAYLQNKPFYGIEFPTTNLPSRLPDTVKYSANPNFLAGGRTAVALGKTGRDGLLVNRTRELVTDSFEIPKGSVLFRIDRNGRKTIIKRY